MAKISVKICAGIHCAVRGGQEILEIFETDAFLQEHCQWHSVNCLNCCQEGKLSPVIEVNGTCLTRMTADKTIGFVSSLVNSK